MQTFAINRERGDGVGAIGAPKFRPSVIPFPAEHATDLIRARVAGRCIEPTVMDAQRKDRDRIAESTVVGELILHSAMIYPEVDLEPDREGFLSPPERFRFFD